MVRGKDHGREPEATVPDATGCRFFLHSAFSHGASTAGDSWELQPHPERVGRRNPLQKSLSHPADHALHESKSMV
jgi:hypothetical protein